MKEFSPFFFSGGGNTLPGVLGLKKREGGGPMLGRDGLDAMVVRLEMKGDP